MREFDEICPECKNKKWLCAGDHGGAPPAIGYEFGGGGPDKNPLRKDGKYLEKEDPLGDYLRRNNEQKKGG